MSREIYYLVRFRFPCATAQSIQVLNTCRALAEEGAFVRLIATRNPDLPIGTVEEGLAFYGMAPHERLIIELHPSNDLLRSLLARWRVWRARPGTVFYSRHMALAVTAAQAARGTVVVELHGVEKSTGAAVAKANGVVTITRALANRVEELYRPTAPVESVPDGVEPTLFAPVAGKEAPRLVYMGHFHDWKGVDVLVRSLKVLPGVGALVIGGQPGEDERRSWLQALAEREGVGDRIEWTGFLSQPEIVTRLRHGDIGVLPTRSQNGQDVAASPLKLFEYLACGLPVVATDMASIREIVRDGENGLLFRDGDAAGLAMAVRRLVERPAERRRMGERCHRDAQIYSWRNRARRILEFVEHVCPA